MEHLTMKMDELSRRIWARYMKRAEVDTAMFKYREFMRDAMRRHPGQKLRLDLAARYVEMANEDAAHYQFLIKRRGVLEEAREWVRSEIRYLQHMEQDGWPPATALLANMRRREAHALHELGVIDVELATIKPAPSSDSGHGLARGA